MFITISGMTMGYNINATLILPIGISFFLVTIYYAVKNEFLFDFRIWIPFTVMWKLHQTVYKEYLISEDGPVMTPKQRRENREKMYYLKAILDTKGSQGIQIEIARSMGVSESTVSKKIAKFGLRKYIV